MAIGPRDFGVLAAGVVLGLVPGYFLFGGDGDVEGGDFQAYVAEASEDVANGAAKQRGASGLSASECEETLDLVRQAHAEAIERYSSNQEMVDHLTDLVERSGLGSPEGRPMDFPEMLDEEFRPENFGSLVEEMMAECPEVFGSGTSWECDEYPCAIEFTIESDEPLDATTIREMCPAIQQRLGQGAFPFPMRVDDDTYYRMQVMGSGVGLGEFWRENHGNFQRRAQHRYQERNRELVGERHEEACLVERAGESCLAMGRAYWTDDESRDMYWQTGCDAGYAPACHSLAFTLCVQQGRCDNEALEYAEQAIALNAEAGRYHQTLATIQCQLGRRAQADGAYQAACELGHEEACGQSCRR